MGDGLLINSGFKENLEDSEQLTFFQFLETPNFSNTINLFDCIPFYVQQQPRKNVDILKRNFIFEDKKEKIKREYLLKLSRGSFTKEFKKGEKAGTEETTFRFLNTSDFNVVQVLLKFAVDGQAFVSGGHVSVPFSLYQLFHELKRLDRRMPYDRIAESIEILSSAQTDLFWTDGDGMVRSIKNTILSDRRFIDPKELSLSIDLKAKKRLYCVTLHPLITKSIVDLSFRQYDYEFNLRLPDYLSRWLHKKISHSFNWANVNSKNPFHLALSSIISNSGILAYKDINKNIKRIEDVLDHLCDLGMLEGDRTNTERKYSTAGGKGKTVDAVFNIFPTAKFAKQQKIANSIHKEVKRNNSKSFLLGMGQLKGSLGNP